MIHNRICAIVVTFNRKNLLEECLESLKAQIRPLDGIYVIDNDSSDGTDKLLLDYGYIDELPPADFNGTWNKCCNIKNSVDGKKIDFRYVCLSENTGGAGGFYEGVKRAYEDGYDWLWLMDDDAEPLEDALEKLSEYFDEENISALAGVVKNLNDKIIESHRGFYDFNKFSNYLIIDGVKTDSINTNKVLKIDFASFVGILVNKKAISNIGFPKKEFFVHSDDFEYCIRLNNFGQILLITDSIIIHKEKTSSKFLERSLLGHTFLRLDYKDYWIHYYPIRNNIWILKRNRKPIVNFWILLIISWIFNIFLITLFDDKKFKRFIFLTSAYIDALKDNFDNRKPKQILYE